MKTYGQFCPLALTSEIVGERWTMLVLRELLCGATRFNEIHRGVPRMSPTLLAQRLRALERAGIVTRASSGYRLTEAGAELGQVIEGLAVWGKTWLPATLSADEADPDLIMWDMHRRMDRERMPATRTVIRFDFSDQPEPKRLRWIVGDRAEVELCIVDPGYEIDLYVETDSRTLTWVWYGDIPLAEAIADDLIVLDGPRRLREAFPRWLLLNPLAPIPRRRPLHSARAAR
jgi:DNA-binding HxlR family transcriptional regulator